MPNPPGVHLGTRGSPPGSPVHACGQGNGPRELTRGRERGERLHVVKRRRTILFPPGAVGVGLGLQVRKISGWSACVPRPWLSLRHKLHCLSSSFSPLHWLHGPAGGAWLVSAGFPVVSVGALSVHGMMMNECGKDWLECRRADREGGGWPMWPRYLGCYHGWEALRYVRGRQQEQGTHVQHRYPSRTGTVD